MRRIFTPSKLYSVFMLFMIMSLSQNLRAQCAPDVVPPTVTCPPAATVECDDDTAAAITAAEFVALGGTISDDCSELDALTISSVDVSVNPGTCPSSFTRTYTITDEAGNSATCDQEFTVNDITSPSVENCPAAMQSVFVDENCSAMLSLTSPSFSDNCGVTASSYTLTNPDGSLVEGLFTDGEMIDFTIMGGSSSLTYRVEDGCMNMDSCTVNIEGVDTIAPMLTVPADMTITLDPLACDSIINYVVEGVDNCEIPITVSQLNNNTVIENSVACPSGNYSHFRVFQAGSFESFTLENVVIGVFESFNAPTVTVTLHMLNGSFVLANLTEVASNSMTLGDLNMEFIDFPISASLDNNFTYVLEVTAPPQLNSGFIIGTNFQGEMNDSYLQSTICNVPEPATMTALGFSTHSSVIYMEGTSIFIEQSAGLAPGSVFPIGTTTNIYQATDISGNVTMDTFDITVEEFVPVSFGSIGELNVSVDDDCFAEITPDMVLVGEGYGCLENCEVLIFDEEGNEIPNQFDASDIGRSYMYQVNCTTNSSMGVLNIEDKFPPQLICTNDTITCADLITFPLPLVDENCTSATVQLVSETFEDVSCDDTLLQQIITREYIAIDAAGNESEVCSQVLSIERLDIGTVMPPAVLIYNFQCNDVFPTDNNGNPDPEVYGSPRLNGQNLYPGQLLVCNLLVTYEDQLIPTGFTNYSIVRTWDATNWYCGQDTMAQFVQVFNFNDTEGPELDCPGDLTFSTSGYDCAASIELPEVGVNDDCSDLKSITTQYEGGFIEGNGGIANLPVGMSTVTVIARDIQDNVNSCTYNVTVVDNENPIAVCDQFTTVSLTNDGIAVVDAEDFDDGSFDSCSPVTIEVRRMNATCDLDDAFFGPSVTFCCEDLGEEQTVVLRVTDAGGNTNECMVIAEVQDKIAPVIVQGLPDITLSCEFPFSNDDTEQFGTIQMDIDNIEPILLTADSVNFSGPAFDGLVMGNCVELVSDEFTFNDINNCGIGSATRVITFRNQQGLTATDIQFIRFVNPSPFGIDDIDFPDDITLNFCGAEAADPLNLPDGFNFPVFIEDGCDQPGYDYEDFTIDNSNGAEACLKIIRTWTVVDWCQNVDNVFPTWSADQIIIIENTVAPEITGDCTDRQICSYDINCGPAFIELINDATDDCTDSVFLQWTYAIDANDDGTIDIVGNTNDASGVYPVGTHRINWVVRDGCGNEDACSYLFTIDNCKAPSPYCLDNLTAGLTPMDLDGDGEVDTEMLMIEPSFFDAGSFHVCGTPVTLSFSSDVNDQLRTFGCDDIGEQPIELWVTDINGNQDFCITSLEVMDNNNVDFCPDVDPLVNIVGELKTEDDEMIAMGTVTLEGGEAFDITEEDGKYAFPEMPAGGEYVIRPAKNIEPLNGITTLDIVLTQKHILGLDPLDSPYKLLAADVNNSGDISGLDIVQLRKLLLGYYEELPDNDSWRFIDTEYEFVDPTNPWMEEFAETVHIGALDANIVADFYGVKIGDVNNSAQPNTLIGEEINIRTKDTRFLKIDDIRLVADQPTWIEFSLNTNDVAALQIGARMNSDIEILEVQGEAWSLNSSNYRTEGNEFRLIWNMDFVGAFAQNEKLVVFKMLLSSKRNMMASEAIVLDDKILQNEYVSSELEVGAIEFETRERFNAEVFDMYQNTPNPWHAQTEIVIKSDVRGEGSLRVMDLHGKVLLNRSIVFDLGEKIITLERADINATGVLYYEIEIEGRRMMKKMIVMD